MTVSNKNLVAGPLGSDGKVSFFHRHSLLLAMAIVALVVIADQALKIWVKTHFAWGEDVEITPWWHLKFIENNGMAFGIELWSKLFLTFGRIAAVALLIMFLVRMRRVASLRTGFIVSVALIAAGAAGNIFDCVFYGVIFDDPMPPAVAQLFPPDGGYSTWFEGRVVDMLYFPLFDFYWPEWMPFCGGEYFEFFAFIFNIADASICVGVGMLIFIYSRDVSIAFNSLGNKKKEEGAGTGGDNGNSHDGKE